MPDAPDAVDALFVRDGETFVPSIYTQGPWDPGAQFGGSPAALLATLVEQTPTLVPMLIARFTLDLLRPVPLAPLHADVRIVRQGKRIQVVAASLLADGVEVARASALRMRELDLDVGPLPDGLDSVAIPDAPRPADDEPIAPSARSHGSRRAVEYLFQGTGGHYHDPMWVRLAVPVLAGEPVSPVAKLAYIADLASGTGQPKGLPVLGINADLAINVVRYPEGEWMRLEGTGWISQTGIGQVQATISDAGGVACAVSMSRLVDPSSA